MTMFIKILTFLLFIFLVIFISWRFLSTRYSLPCPSWLGWMVEMDNPFTNVNRAATIIEHLDVAPGMTVLDIGCGPGRVTIPLAKTVGPDGKVVAMDIQEEMLAKVKQKAAKENVNNISYLHAGIGENKLEKNAFDRIVLVTVLGEIPNQKAALQEIYNALKSDGILSVTELVFDPHFQRKSTVLSVANQVGFEEKAFFGSWYAYTMHLTKK